MSKEFRIEVTGTHDETDLRPWQTIIDRLLIALQPAGYKVDSYTADRVTAASAQEVAEQAEAEESDVPEFLGFMLFDPRGLTGAEVKLRIAEIEELSVLQAGAALERLNPKNQGGRVSVINAIEVRIQKIIG